MTQFQGAFSDNLFKFLVIFLITRRLPPDQRDQAIPVVLTVFSLPFVLFSMAGGYLADRLSKRTVIIGTKVAELGIMALSTVGFLWGDIRFLMGVTFLMGAQSAFFSPSKYGSLPELLPRDRLSWGNGILGLGTFMAIILGGLAAGLLSDAFRDRQVGSGVLLMVLAGAGLLVSRRIEARPPANPTKRFRLNFLADMWSQLRRIRHDIVLLLAILGSVYFWFLAAVFDPTILIYGKDLLGLSDTESGLLRAALAVGIGLGSAAAGYLSGRKVEYGLIPLGGMGLTACAAVLAQSDLSFGATATLLGGLGFSGGFFIVPINALVQQRPEPGHKGAVIAADSWLCAVGVLLAAQVYGLLTVQFGLAPNQVFLFGAVVTLAATLYATYRVPDALLRFLFWLLTHGLYRIRVTGRDHVPARGGALLVCNHLSLVDAFLLSASVDRPIRFVMFKGIYEKWWVKPIANIARVIPISSEIRPREMLGSLKAAGEEIQRGGIVCIFAEGQITRIGQLLPFRRGMQKIMAGVEAPIIPAHLDGVWGSIFSFENGRFLWKWPRRILDPVTVSFGPPLPHDTPPWEVRQTVQDLGAQAWSARKARLQPLGRVFVRTMRRCPWRFLMTDPQSPRQRRGTILTKAVFLANRLRRVWGEQRFVGILLPPSVAGALVNYAALLAGKVPVNLNYTLSRSGLESCLRQCGIDSVITSQRFLERAKLDVPGKVLLLEDLVREVRWSERLRALLRAWLFPVRWLERSLGQRRKPQVDDLATVIFSSGSTGDPKGVKLTHTNLLSNAEQLGQIFGLARDDSLVGILPFFHSFGFTGTLVLPAALGVGVAYHANPLEPRVVGSLIQEHRLTFLLATPTFLQIYLRGCTPGQLGSLRLVMVGAEKLSARLAMAFEDKFGLRPVEGYGCTECSPVVAVNTRDYRAAGFHQVGAKRGKIGHPLPGMSLRIVDPDTGTPVPIGQPGLLRVRGPNVMSGYLNRTSQTKEVLEDGWYTTGDIVTMDEDGFLEITDRLSRFSKIGGEMVPHIKVEECLSQLTDLTEAVFAVTGVPDDQKGERLVVLHTLPPDKLRVCLDRLKQADLPNLWKPRRDDFFQLEALPLLGSGKLDLRRVRQIAQERTQASAHP